MRVITISAEIAAEFSMHEILGFLLIVMVFALIWRLGTKKKHTVEKWIK